jgi:cyclic pyranopterin phosphate synthase
VLELTGHTFAPNASLQDAAGRTFRKLRLSLTEACQFQCFYCMPHPSQAVIQPGFLDADGYASIVRGLVPCGLRSVRLTGGEPTLRPDFAEIVLALGAIPGIDLSLTSNGHLLPRHFPTLLQAGVRSVNISLDSLDPATFRAITGRDLAPVVDAIRGARAHGLAVKLNCVALRGLNSSEIPRLLDFASSVGAELRFLELMRIGAVASHHRDRFFPAEEIEAAIRARGPIRALTVPPDSTALRFARYDDSTFGIIASETRPFCDGCSRLRLTARGEMRPCLMSEERIPLGHLAGEALREVARDAFLRKPLSRQESTSVAMHTLGG